MNHPKLHASLRDFWTGRLVGHVFGIVAGFGFGGWDTAEAVHETALVVPSDVVGGDQPDMDKAPAADETAAHGRISA